jgi:hypothetical protein
VAVFTDGIQSDGSGGGGGGVSFSGVTNGAVVKNNAGTPADAVNGIDYVGPQKTANVASATTLPAIPETGALVPVTGTTQIDFITKPTGDAPRYVILWFQSAINVRNNVAGAGGGAANIRMLTGAAANQVTSFAADSLLPLYFDGTVWRMAQDGPHWDGSGIVGSSANAKVILDSATGSRLQFTTTTSFHANGNQNIITAQSTRMTTRIRFDRASVASASTIALPNNCSTILVTGTTTVNSFTFTASNLDTDSIVWLRFDGVLTLTHNAGGTNDFVSKSGANITTAAGMQLAFYFDGTDLVEIGR